MHQPNSDRKRAVSLGRTCLRKLTRSFAIGVVGFSAALLMPRLSAAQAGPAFQDEFTSLSLHENWRVGDKWQLIAPDSTAGRGGPAWNEAGNQWWVNPFNANTPIKGVYELAAGQLRLGIVATPAAYQAYIDRRGGTHLPYVGALLNTSHTNYQRYGYYELCVAVDRVPGFAFQADTENVQVTGHWPPEIDFNVHTDAANVQHVSFKIAHGSKELSYTPSSNDSFDARNDHIYGWDWQPARISFYIDREKVWQTPNPGGVYRADKQFLYLVTYASHPVNVDPSPALLPAYARLSYVRVYHARPSDSLRAARANLQGDAGRPVNLPRRCGATSQY